MWRERLIQAGIVVLGLTRVGIVALAVFIH